MTLALMGAGAETAGGGAGGGFSAAVLALSPSLYWPLDEVSGTTVADGSGNAHTGTAGAGVTRNQASLLPSGSGKSSSFNGSSSAVVTSAFNPFTGSVTFGGWGNVADFAAQRNLFGGSSTTNAPAFVLAGSSGTPNLFTDVGSGAVSWAAGDFPAASNVFWALTYNNATKGSELFVNAVSKGTKTSAVAFNATPGNFQLGTWGTNSSGWSGRQQAAFIVPAILTPTQISNLYAAG